MKILLADDHALLKESLHAFLTTVEDMEVILASDIYEAQTKFHHDGPFDLILIDYAMPGINGLQDLENAVSTMKDTPVALLSGVASYKTVKEALDSGMVGFIPKTLPIRSMVNAIRFMAAGERYLPVDYNESNSAATVTKLNGNQLTQREQDVLRWLCKGASNKEIGREMGLQEPTIKLHVHSLCRKMGARNRTHAVIMAKENGIF